jgi:hypothetical protein
MSRQKRSLEKYLEKQHYSRRWLKIEGDLQAKKGEDHLHSGRGVRRALPEAEVARSGRQKRYLNANALKPVEKQKPQRSRR